MEKTYSETLLVRGGDCDRFSRMRMDALFFAMQEGGEHHAKTMGFGYDAMQARGLFFVLSRIHVCVNRMPVCGERIVHTTWPGVSNKFFCPRFHTFALEDGTPLLSAGALWVILDTQNRRIVSPAKASLPFPDNSDIPDPIALPTRLRACGEETARLMRTPVYSDFDINGHVNNTKYIAWLCDALGSAAFDGAYIRELSVSYEKEIRTETPFALSVSRDADDFTFQVLSEENKKHFFAAGTFGREEAR